MKNLSTYTNITFRGLKKYFKYKVEVRGLTQRGQGPIKAVTVQMKMVAKCTFAV